MPLAEAERPDLALMRTDAQVFCLILTTVGLGTNNSIGVSPNILGAVTSRPQSAARPPQPAARRKAPAQRRAEVIEAAAAIAVRDGLDKVTAKRVAAAIGVRAGLVDHYFTADQLVAAAFALAAAAESDEVFGEAAAIPDAPDQVRHLLGIGEVNPPPRHQAIHLPQSKQRIVMPAIAEKEHLHPARRRPNAAGADLRRRPGPGSVERRLGRYRQHRPQRGFEGGVASGDLPLHALWRL